MSYRQGLPKDLYSYCLHKYFALGYRGAANEGPLNSDPLHPSNQGQRKGKDRQMKREREIEIDNKGELNDNI